MRNAETTHYAILEAAGKMFNLQGYASTSISDITKELGMTKGAIYRHFKNKSDLEKAALRHLSGKMWLNLGERIQGKHDVFVKMDAVFDYFMAYTEESHIVGGCPLLNAAVEADDTNPELCEVVNHIAEQIQSAIIRVLDKGIKYTQLSAQLNVEEYASLVFSSLEGAIMLTRVSKTETHLQNVIKMLKRELERNRI